MTGVEFAEWFQIWQWAPWEMIPEPRQEAEPLDPMAFAKTFGT